MTAEELIAKLPELVPQVTRWFNPRDFPGAPPAPQDSDSEVYIGVVYGAILVITTSMIDGELFILGSAVADELTVTIPPWLASITVKWIKGEMTLAEFISIANPPPDGQG